MPQSKWIPMTMFFVYRLSIHRCPILLARTLSSMVLAVVMLRHQAGQTHLFKSTVISLILLRSLIIIMLHCLVDLVQRAVWAKIVNRLLGETDLPCTALVILLPRWLSNYLHLRVPLPCTPSITLTWVTPPEQVATLAASKQVEIGTAATVLAKELTF